MITKTIRLPSNLNKEINKKAQELNISQNAAMLVLIDLGLKIYRKDIVINQS